MNFNLEGWGCNTRVRIVTNGRAKPQQTPSVEKHALI